MSFRFGWMCIRFLARAAGVPFLLWAILTALRLLLLPVFISDESLWYHSVPFFVELVCFAIYVHRKDQDFRNASPSVQYDVNGKPLPREPGYNTRRATFQLMWHKEAKHDCRINLLYVAFGTPLTFITVIVTAYFRPAWDFWNFLICSLVGLYALRSLVIIAEGRGLEHGLPPLPAYHDRTTVKPAEPETRGRGLITQQEAQAMWLKRRKRPSNE